MLSRIELQSDAYVIGTKLHRVFYNNIRHKPIEYSSKFSASNSKIKVPFGYYLPSKVKM
jgi:hypothetical protein